MICADILLLTLGICAALAAVDLHILEKRERRVEREKGNMLRGAGRKD